MQPMKSSRDRLLPIGEAAALLRLSVDTLRRWDRRDDSPLHAVSRTGAGIRLYSEAEVEALREKRGAA